MHQSNPYGEASIPMGESISYAKKYSLRRRYQNPLRDQLQRSKYTRNQESSFFEVSGGEREGAGQRRWPDDGFGFNCMQSAQRILDFNQATSVSLKNHTKTLSTTPSSFQNPFAQPTRARQQPHPPTRALTKKSLVSSREQLNPSNAKSQKTAVSHKFSQNSSKIGGERLRTENNSQPLSTVNCYGLYDDVSEGQRRGKISLKDTHKLSSQSKSELLICLKYSDLRQPIATKPRHSITALEQSKHPETASLGRYICSSIKSQTGGCQCQPKCIWIDRWMAVIPHQELPNHSLPSSSTEWENTLKQIEKDLPRTQPQSPTFQIAEYINSLREVLVGYARLDWEVGYVQGMNFIAAAIVYHSRSSYEGLRVMEHIMRGNGFRKILLKDLAMSHLVARRCMYELKRLAFDLYSHFMSQDLQLQVFITSWYFSLLGNFVPLKSMHLVLDKFMRSQFTGLNEIIITMLIYLKSGLLSLFDHSLMMAFSSQQITLTAGKIDWEELVWRSDHLLLDPLPI